MSFADLLQLVKTTSSKPVDNKFWQSTCNKSVDYLQQVCRQQAVARHANASWYRLVVTSSSKMSTDLLQLAHFWLCISYFYVWTYCGGFVNKGYITPATNIYINIHIRIVTTSFSLWSVSTKYTQPKTPQTCCKLLQQACYNHDCCNLSFADLLQLVETTCNKPVDNKFWQSTCNRLVINKLSQAVRTHPDIGLLKQAVTKCQQNCCDLCIFGCIDSVKIIFVELPSKFILIFF